MHPSLRIPHEFGSRPVEKMENVDKVNVNIMHIMGLYLCLPPNPHFCLYCCAGRILSPQIEVHLGHVTLFGNRVFSGVITMMSRWIIMSAESNDWGLFPKRRGHPETHTGKRAGWRDSAASQGTASVLSSHQQRGEKRGPDLQSEPPEGGPAYTLTSDL